LNGIGIVVLDASAAVRVAMEPASGFRGTLASAGLVVAPELIVAEACSALWKYVRAGVLTRADAAKSAKRALALIDRMQPLRELMPDVFALTSQLESSVYDLFYLALALRTGGHLLTADVALLRAARKVGLEATGE
jgi:predicted nucleic acid-binding protein